LSVQPIEKIEAQWNRTIDPLVKRNFIALSLFITTYHIFINFKYLIDMPLTPSIMKIHD